MALRSQHIAQLGDECEVLVARTPILRKECFRLRHQVYCLEKQYEEVTGDEETDPYDGYARHILLRHRESGDSVGTVRIIPASPFIGLDGVPMSKACAPGLLRPFPAETTGEISRFALSKTRRLNCGAGTMTRLGLIQGFFRLTKEMNLTHWVAIMEPSLMRLLRTDGVDFSPVGPLVEYHGLRQPAVCDIAETLEHMYDEHWDVWNYVTLGGRLLNGNVWAGTETILSSMPLEMVA